MESPAARPGLGRRRGLTPPASDAMTGAATRPEGVAAQQINPRHRPTKARYRKYAASRRVPKDQMATKSTSPQPASPGYSSASNGMGMSSVRLEVLEQELTVDQ